MTDSETAQSRRARGRVSRGRRITRSSAEITHWEPRQTAVSKNIASTAKTAACTQHSDNFVTAWRYVLVSIATPPHSEPIRTLDRNPHVSARSQGNIAPLLPSTKENFCGEISDRNCRNACLRDCSFGSRPSSAPAARARLFRGPGRRQDADRQVPGRQGTVRQGTGRRPLLIRATISPVESADAFRVCAAYS